MPQGALSRRSMAQSLGRSSPLPRLGFGRSRRSSARLALLLLFVQSPSTVFVAQRPDENCDRRVTVKLKENLRRIAEEPCEVVRFGSQISDEGARQRNLRCTTDEFPGSVRSMCHGQTLQQLQKLQSGPGDLPRGSLQSHAILRKITKEWKSTNQARNRTPQI